MSKAGGLVECTRWLADALSVGRGPDPSVANPASAELLLLDRLEPERFLAALADGQVLLLLLRRLRGSDSTVSVTPPGQAAVEEFLRACVEEFGIPKDSLFHPRILHFKPADPQDVLRCLRALSQTDAAASAGLLALAIAVDDVDAVDDGVYMPMDSKTDERLRWIHLVMGVFDQLIGFFHTCRVLERELRESPLSLWPSESMDVVFRPSMQLLDLLLGLRAAVRSGRQPLDVAITERLAQLAQLYADQRRHLYLKVEPLLGTLPEGCLAQAALVLANISQQQREFQAKSVQELQLMPLGHLKRLSDVMERSLQVVRSRIGERGADDARQQLEGSLVHVHRLEALVNAYAEGIAKELLPSFAEVSRLKWPQKPGNPPALDDLGMFRRGGWLQQAGIKDSKRVWATLWDQCLVLASSSTCEVIDRWDITKDLLVAEVIQKGTVGLGRRWSLQLSGAQLPDGSQKLTCDSQPDCQAWLSALKLAKSGSHPEGCDKHAHSFCRVAIQPDELINADCSSCSRPLSYWAYKCARCGKRLHGECVTIDSTRSEYVKCKPMPRPRGFSAQQLQQEDAPPPLPPRDLEWRESVVMDIEQASIRLRELRRGRRKRNFLVSPAPDPSRQSSYQLHVLSGDDSVVTYHLEKTPDSHFRIEGATETFQRLSELVKHYQANPLPCTSLGEQEDIYEPMSELLVLDSGLADCTSFLSTE